MNSNMTDDRKDGHADVTYGTKGRAQGPDSAKHGLHAYNVKKTALLAGGAKSPSCSGVNYKGVSNTSY